MKLSRTERWILANQYRILELLDPGEAEGHARAREALENGYEVAYDWLCEDVDRRGLSEEECTEVIDILDMFEAIRRVEDKSGIDEWRTKFGGFDGNNEAAQMGFARYFCENGHRFAELDKGDNFNSHCPTLQRYRPMLREWKSSKDKYNLTRNDLVRITSVAPED
jgi:uncharacterized protein YfbU (UPF0304 family)